MHCDWLTRVFNLDFNAMDEELEESIERAKKKISDYRRIAPLIGISQEEMDFQTDIMLEDLSKLMKKRKK